MYGVSEDFLNAMIRPVQQHKIYGQIGTIDYTDANILEGSMQILQQCSGNSEVQIGQVNISELTATFVGIDDISRGAWQGKEITVFFALLTDAEHDTWESVPVGLFTIQEAEWSVSGITVKAYDNMAKLDKRCGQRFVSARPYTMLDYACNQCGLTLGNTQGEIEAMPNGQDVMTEYEENDIETWRDLVSWLAQTLCGFAYAGRDGKIYIKQYTSNTTLSFNYSQWFHGASFSDFTTKYTGISVVNIKYGTTNYYSLPVDDGLTYNLGQNPFLQNYSNGTERRARILNALTAINYTPFKLDMIGSIAFDLGDVLHFSEGSAGLGVDCCITKILYKHKRGVSLQGVGKNPATASAKSKTDKNISGLLDRVTNTEFRFDVIRPNAEEITIGTNKEKRLNGTHSIYFTTGGNAQIHVNAEIHLEATQTSASAPVVARVRYQVDDFEDTWYPVESWNSGKHILTLNYHIDAAQGIHALNIYIKVLSGGTIKIEPMSLVTFMGTNIMVQDGFNGFIDVEDTLGMIEIEETSVDIRSMEDDGVIWLVPVNPRTTCTDELGALEISEATVDLTDVDDDVLITLEVESAQRITEVLDDRITEQSDNRFTEGDTWQI